MRLIDANALWADVMMLPHNGDMISSEEVEQTIKNAPTVDAVEVVHGWWMPQYDRCWIDGQRWKTGYHCSACMGFNKVKSHYCPNCGAKMDGDGNV